MGEILNLVLDVLGLQMPEGLLLEMNCVQVSIPEQRGMAEREVEDIVQQWPIKAGSHF